LTAGGCLARIWIAEKQALEQEGLTEIAETVLVSGLSFAFFLQPPVKNEGI
jgi:hypothetical protein